MTPRLRVARMVVQVEAYSDDGEYLSPVPVQPLVVEAAHIREFLSTGYDAALAALREQVEREPEVDSASTA